MKKKAKPESLATKHVTQHPSKTTQKASVTDDIDDEDLNAARRQRRTKSRRTTNNCGTVKHRGKTRRRRKAATRQKPISKKPSKKSFLMNSI